jgi:hypothetical protein
MEQTKTKKQRLQEFGIMMLILLILWLVKYAFQINWDKTTYYPNWQVEMHAHMSWWKIDWDVIAYYENWVVRFKYHKKKWLFDWKFLSYYENW